MTTLHTTPTEVIYLAIRLRRSYYPLRRKLMAAPPTDRDGRSEPVAPSMQSAEKKKTFALEV